MLKCLWKWATTFSVARQLSRGLHKIEEPNI
jgi:hypothetical protein